ncbi:MAG: hypothetical protein KG029_20870 [Bacteroidetes bacterium]|jgi:hypothetical protein|nr:hypothetical protein [Bacteroidota bacterium]
MKKLAITLAFFAFIAFGTANIQAAVISSVNTEMVKSDDGKKKEEAKKADKKSKKGDCCASKKTECDDKKKEDTK